MPTFFLSTFVVVIVYHPCEFIIRLAVRQQTNVTHTSTCDGTVVPQHGVFTVSFYFYCVMTQSEAHNVDQAWWPGVCVCVHVCLCVRERITDCVCVCGEKKKDREKVCVLLAKQTLNSFIPSTPLYINQWALNLLECMPQFPHCLNKPQIKWFNLFNN